MMNRVLEGRSWKLGVYLSKRNLFRHNIFFSGLFLVFSGFSFGQITTEIDTAHIKIGEPIQYKLTVPFHSGQQIILPQHRDTLSFHIEILDQKTDTVSAGKMKKIIQQLSITSFDAGDFLIRSFPVIINGDTLLSRSFQIKVDDVEIDSSNLSGFPIKPIMEEEYTWKDYWQKYWMYCVAGALVFIALLVVAILFLKDKKRKEEKSRIIKTPYEEAIDALKNIDKKKYLEKGQVYPFYSDLSYALRRYVGRVYNFSSLELLSDDLVDYFRKSTHLEKEEIEKLKEFLYDSDLVKFAKAEPDEEKHLLYRKWVENLIEKIKPLELEDESVQEIRPNEKYRKLR